MGELHKWAIGQELILIFIGKLGYHHSCLLPSVWLDLGYPVTVWNLEPERLETVVPHGAMAAPTPAAVAAASDVVMLCVLHMAAVERCVFADDGVAAAGRGPSLLIDFSTADPEREIIGPLGYSLLPVAGVLAILYAVRHRRAAEPLIPRGVVRARVPWALLVSFLVAGIQ